MSTSPKGTKRAPKKTAVKVVKDVNAPASETEATPTASKRGKVLKLMSIEKILAFVGGDTSTLIEVSKKSLVTAKTRNARAEAASDLDGLDAL